jgi:hypothetical protein
MGKLWQREQDGQGQSLLKEADWAALKVEGPVLVYLSGFLTTDRRPDYIAGGIKRMEELLKDRTLAKPKIYAWSHGGLSNLFNLAAYNMRPNSRSSKAGYDLGASILMPLVAKGFSRAVDGMVQGTPLPLEDAKRNLRNVTFFGYSAGSVVAQETFNATLKMMRRIGYDEKDARKVLNEVVLVSAGTISRPSKEKDRFSTVYLIASNDRLNRFKNWVWGTMGTALRSVFDRFRRKGKEGDLTVRPLSATSVFISTTVRPSLYEWKYDEEGNRVAKKPFPPLYPAWTLRRSYHELPHYITTDDSNNNFSRIALYPLVNALDRADTPAPVKLIEPPANDNFDAAAQAAYRARISLALKPMPGSG